MNAVPSSRSEPVTFKDATRSLTSVLAPIEKRVLVWLAGRMPGFIHSDHLTVLALLAMLAAGLSYWWASANPIGLAAAVVFLAVNWFGDSLDGTLARVRRTERPRYGFYVDHVIDEFGVAFVLGGLALSGYMTPWVAALLLISYLMLCVEVFLATHTLGTFRMSYFKVGPTELRILLSIGSLVAIVHPHANVAGREFLLFDVGGVVGAAGLFLTLIRSAVSNTRTLCRLEPRRADAR
jgi:phosphatidylglycerophosphate synthase